MDIQERIEELARRFEAKVEERRKRDFPNTQPAPVTVQYGKKYAKIVLRGHSVSAFVNLETGDILYPASWKAPAKGIRGSVLVEDFGLSCFGDWGVKTLR